jgi:hypothetical protein
MDYAPETVPVSKVDAILAACSGVTTLFVHNQSPAAGLLARLKCMRRLEIPVEALFAGQTAAVDFTTPLFRNMTHLCLRGTRLKADIRLIWTSLACIPHLTHVAFDTSSITALTPALTKENTRLRCIVHHSWGDVEDEEDVEIFRPLSDDARFVCIEHWGDCHLDWLRGTGAVKGDDDWALAEDFIAAKRAGTVDREPSLPAPASI